MADGAEVKRLTFTWDIKNFSMCPHKTEQNIASPAFKVDALDKTEWQFEVYPRDNIAFITDDYVSCGLRSISSQCYSCETFYSKFELISAEGEIHESTNIRKEIAEDPEGSMHHVFITHSKLFRKKNILLPNDVLTIRCHMWRADNDITIDDDVLEDILLDDILPATRCRVQTQIKVHKNMFLWPVKRFHALGENQEMCFQLVAAVNGTPAFDLKTIRNSQSCYGFEIHRRGGNGQVFVRCKISLFEITGRFHLAEESDYLFEDGLLDEVWEFPSSFYKHWSALQYKTRVDDLFIRCEFAFSVYGTEETSQDRGSSSANFRMNYGSVNTLGNELHQLYKEKKFCDATLQVQDRTFPVHSIVLCARSAVFRAMFEHETKERESGTVVISDLNPDIAEHMLSYLYTGQLVDLEQDDVIQLYSAADKYELLALKDQCGDFLKSSLSFSNVYKILMLASMHQDESLMEAVKNHISANSTLIFRSGEWKDFMKKNSELAAVMMHSFISGGIH